MTEPASEGLQIQVRQQLDTFQLEADLSLPQRGVTALFGVSGSGKTSLLRLIAGLDRPQQGRILIGGEPLADTGRGLFVPPQQRHLGVVFQEARLFPHYRVRGNLAYGMPRKDRTHFDAIVRLLGLGHLLDRFPATLSGGEARRVAIGRALLSRPRMLLMDEPLSGLDGPRKQELLDFILQLTRQIDIPVIYVSHDPEELTAIADYLVLMDQGHVIADGPLDELLMRFDLTPYLGGFNAASILETQVQAHDLEYHLTLLKLADGQTLTVPLIGDAPEGHPIRLRIPVREVALALAPQPHSSYRNQLEAIIEDAAVPVDNPAAMELRLTIGGQALRARLTRKSYDEMGLAQRETVTALVRTIAFAQRP
ncbi:molybdenum ABC transporter ATP-binding protein [Marinobacter fonticola]|uniref:molybdenum ABC transporter ATP-binding protein n=1 Tax=Marinobacter fonticola TaxID=2603215 RepID=UPI0011E860F6|nr:molybdenum ABC transporter ATP-binding protein [Marinobacter fonticola]